MSHSPEIKEDTYGVPSVHGAAGRLTTSLLSLHLRLPDLPLLLCNRDPHRTRTASAPPAESSVTEYPAVYKPLSQEEIREDKEREEAETDPEETSRPPAALVVPISVVDLTARSPLRGGRCRVPVPVLRQPVTSDTPTPSRPACPPSKSSPRGGSDWPMTPEPQSLFASDTIPVSSSTTGKRPSASAPPPRHNSGDDDLGFDPFDITGKGPWLTSREGASQSSHHGGGQAAHAAAASQHPWWTCLPRPRHAAITTSSHT
ncbi:hypothetical protein J4Q44_G00111240 [Coregonus suidteri]|uniref:Uncharacterized protein n=1 Tax=Coregonus suidteri TaxID=861788 RepID=A0AAN8LSH0_9TELE